MPAIQHGDRQEVENRQVHAEEREEHQELRHAVLHDLHGSIGNSEWTAQIAECHLSRAKSTQREVDTERGVPRVVRRHVPDFTERVGL